MTGYTPLTIERHVPHVSRKDLQRQEDHGARRDEEAAANQKHYGLDVDQEWELRVDSEHHPRRRGRHLNPQVPAANQREEVGQLH